MLYTNPTLSLVLLTEDPGGLRGRSYLREEGLVAPPPGGCGGGATLEKKALWLLERGWRAKRRQWSELWRGKGR